MKQKKTPKSDPSTSIMLININILRFQNDKFSVESDLIKICSVHKNKQSCNPSFDTVRCSIDLHWMMGIAIVEATELSEFTSYAHILRIIYNHDVATPVPSWQQCVLLS